MHQGLPATPAPAHSTIGALGSSPPGLGRKERGSRQAAEPVQGTMATSRTSFEKRERAAEEVYFMQVGAGPGQGSGPWGLPEGWRHLPGPTARPRGLWVLQEERLKMLKHLEKLVGQARGAWWWAAHRVQTCGVALTVVGWWQLHLALPSQGFLCLSGSF